MTQSTTDAIPVIGDKVYIAPGCRVFGKITLGDGCAVGANSGFLRRAAGNDSRRFPGK